MIGVMMEIPLDEKTNPQIKKVFPHKKKAYKIETIKRKYDELK